MKMPKVVFVRIDKDSDGSEYLNAYTEMDKAVEGDGPTTIGVFKFVETVKRKKILAQA